MSPTILKTLLVPTGFSAKCENALRLAAEMAQRHDAKIILFHVVPLQYLIDRTGRQIIGRDTTQITIEQAAEKLLSYKEALMANHPGLQIETHVKMGMLPDVVNDLTVSASADLVILGTSGEQKWKQMILGSYSYDILRDAPCPVLLVPQRFEKRAFSNILFPVRVTDYLELKLELAVAIAERNHAHINLYGVCDADNLEEIRERFKVAEAGFKDKVRSFRSELVLTDDKAEAISHESNEKDCDLVILSHKDEFVWKSVLLENFFRKIINGTDAALLFVKPRLIGTTEIQDGGTSYDITMPVPG